MSRERASSELRSRSVIGFVIALILLP